MTDIFEVIRSQRACRNFSDQPVDDETVGRLLDAATHAPSAENRQPWVFLVVRDAATRARLHDLSEHAWEQGGRAYSTGYLAGLLRAVNDLSS